MFDSVQGWVFGAGVLVVALAAAWVCGAWLKLHAGSGRNTAIDGLRGYLATGVVVHHATVTYYFLHGQAWTLPPAGPYRDLGSTCVNLFFMITAYLFVGKLLDARKRPIDWPTLFASRVLRLAPLYLIVMAILFATVGWLSGWQARDSWAALVSDASQWLGFTVLGWPDLNGRPLTWTLMAGVTWTLAYEWLFYLSLPLIAVALRVRVPLILAATCAVVLFVLIRQMPWTHLPLAFVSGAVAAFVARLEPVAQWLRRPLFGCLVLAAAMGALSGVAPAWLMKLSLTLAFFIVASGNTVFGLLSHRAAVVLGDISYGIYLMHGLFLFWLFRVLLGTTVSASLSPVAFWLVGASLSAGLVVAAALSYRFIERPALGWVKPAVAWLRARTQRKLVAASDSRLPGTN